MLRYRTASILGLAVLAACGETTGQRATTGAVGGGIAGAVVAGPIGAVVGAGLGAVGGAGRDLVDKGTDKVSDVATKSVTRVVETEEPEQQATRARSAERTAGPRPTNEQVKQAQVALRDMKLYDGRIDGIYGPKTIKGVSEFQAQNELPVTGMLDERTRAALQQASAAGAMQSRETGRQESTPPRMESPAEQPAATQTPEIPRPKIETKPLNQ